MVSCLHSCNKESSLNGSSVPHLHSLFGMSVYTRSLEAGQGDVHPETWEG